MESSRRSLWLDLLLSHTCGSDLTRQARLLFLVFGPTKVFRYGPGLRGAVIWLMWKEVSDPLDDDGAHAARVAFQPLASAIGKCYLRTKDSLYGLIRQIAEIAPEEGMDAKNVAAILMLSTPYVRQTYLSRY